MKLNAETVYTGYEDYKNDPSTVLGFREKNKDSKGWGSRPISKSSTDEDIKAKIKNAVSKSKSFKMPKAKTNKGGAGGGLGFKLKKR